MNSDFPRIITLLRKEKGINQKNAAESLGISQSLLSHYEKGKRECGLEFVVKCAKLYDVSCDYLLGTSAERNGAKITVDEIPDADSFGKNNVMRGSILPTLNKKLISNSLNVIFDLLSKCNNKELTTEISTYLMLSVYDGFRILHSANEENQSNLFSVPENLYLGYSDGEKSISKANAVAMAKGTDTSEKELLRMTTQSLTDNYQTSAQSLFNLIQNVEAKMLEKSK